MRELVCRNVQKRWKGIRASGRETARLGWKCSGFAFMLFLGAKFLLAKTSSEPMHLSRAAEKIETRIEQTLHPHSAFM